jgi:aminoglycoside phosphotransferase
VNLLEDYLAHADLSTAPVLLREFRPAGALLVTPRYNDSRHVVVLLLDPSANPRIVGKIVRRPHDRSTLATEFDVLERLAAQSADVRTAPRPLAFVQHRDHWMLVETAVTGVVLTHRRMKKSPQRVWRLVDDWLCGLPSVTTTAESERWFDEQIANPMRLATSTLHATADERRLFAATKRALRELTAADLPMPLEHGDLSHPNLLLSEHDRLAVVDWETGRVSGLAGADAAVFLAFLSFSLDGAHGVEAEAQCYGRSFLRPNGAGRLRLRDHLERQAVDPKWLDLILLATWARYALQVFPRLAPRGEADPDDRIKLAGELFRSGRPLRLWRMTLDYLAG